MKETYEQWFSNDKMSGKSVALNAVSAIASNTSYTTVSIEFSFYSQSIN